MNLFFAHEWRLSARDKWLMRNIILAPGGREAIAFVQRFQRPPETEWEMDRVRRVQPEDVIRLLVRLADTVYFPEFLWKLLCAVWKVKLQDSVVTAFLDPTYQARIEKV